MDFEEKLKANMKLNKLSDSSIKLYVRNLKILNDSETFKNLNFLRKKDVIEQKLQNYKPNTVRNYIISIIAGLAAIGDKDTPLYKFYHKKMMQYNKDLRLEENKQEKSDTQKENWIEWDDIQDIVAENKEKVDEFIKKKKLNEHQYNTLLNYVILCLYTTSIEPRRNGDYLNCYVVRKYTDKLDDKKNYLDLDKKEFIFNVFKTAKTEGQKIIKIDDNLFDIIKSYLNHSPVYNAKDKNLCVPFLVTYGGNNLQINGITIRLNTIFKKKVSSTMLRHIYLTKKYGKVQEEMQKTASNMGHSSSMQNNYIKKD